MFREEDHEQPAELVDVPRTRPTRGEAKKQQGLPLPFIIGGAIGGGVLVVGLVLWLLLAGSDGKPAAPGIPAPTTAAPAAAPPAAVTIREFRKIEV